MLEGTITAINCAGTYYNVYVVLSPSKRTLPIRLQEKELKQLLGVEELGGLESYIKKSIYFSMNDP